MTDHALLLVNLGSPASTAVADVRSYLNEFLMDPHVIDLPWPLRRLLVAMILVRRPAASAEAYRSIWWEEGSPLVVLSRRLQAQQGPLDGRLAVAHRQLHRAVLPARGHSRLQPPFVPSRSAYIVLNIGTATLAIAALNSERLRALPIR